MSEPLSGKVVLVTGSAKRVGAAIARRLHREGANLMLHYRGSEREARALRAELNVARTDSVALVQADLLDIAGLSEIVRNTLGRFDRLDALVNNASTFFPTPVGEMTQATWESLIGANLRAPLFLAQAAAPHLKKAGGTIVNITDIHAERPLKNYVIYSVAKAGLVGRPDAPAHRLEYGLEAHRRSRRRRPRRVLFDCRSALRNGADHCRRWRQEHQSMKKLTPHLPDLRRRRAVAATLAVGTGALLGSRAALLLAQESALRATPAMTLGPFYPDRLPAEQDADLTVIAGRPGRAAGQILYLAGRVLDTRGKPLPGAHLELWQANAHGRYIHSGDSDASGPLDPNFQGYASLRADAEGRYRIKTVKPAPYSGRTAHLHFNVDARGAKLTTQMIFEGGRLNERDGLYLALSREERRAATGHWVDRAPGMEADAIAVAWDIVLSPT